jgi:hypothetical protein
LNNNTAELGLRFSGKRVCPDVTGLSLKEAEQLLEENDFENHGYEVVTDDWVWNKNNWQVIYQSVPAGEVTDVATEIELKVQSYDSIKENGILLGENETISDNAVAVESIDGTEVETEIEDDTLGDMLEEETEDIDEAETTVSTENTDDLTSETSSEQIEIDPNDIEIIKSVQVALNEAGYDCGTADGIVGENTRNAIIAYEKASGITEDGEITGELVKSLGIIDGYNTSDFTQELAERAAVVAMMNCYAMDVYTDGDYDPQKFHVYGENSEYLLSIYQEGVWEKVNDNTWHVDEMILRKDDSTTDFYLRVFLDVTFDGRNYIVSNVKENHQKLEYIYDTDPSKYCYSEYEPSDANPFLTVSPEMIYDNTSEKLESEKTIESQETEGKTNKKDELPESTAKRAFEYMGEALYPYGFKCHWFTGTMVHEQYNDGSWFFKVQVTVTNKYGTEKDAIAEALVNNTTEAVEDFKLYDK